MPASPDQALPAFISRLQRFESVDSTQSVVRGWLAAGVPEVCVAVADEQVVGRGRMGRAWQAPPGRALLASFGVRPPELAVRHGWRLGAIAAMAMLEAASARLGPTADRLALKWPNDIVAVRAGRLRKLAGILAEGVPREGRLDSAVVGVGINVTWPAAQFPPELADSMWSLSASSGRSIDREALLLDWLVRLEWLYESLCAGAFDVDRWLVLQVTTGARVEVDQGGELVRGTAVGLDGESGALLVQREPGVELSRIEHGDVVHCRLVESPGDL